MAKKKRPYNRRIKLIDEPKETFQILDHVPHGARKSRMSVEEAKKYENTLRLLEVGKRSTVLKKDERMRMIGYVKKNHPNYVMRSVRSDKKGESFIVWRER